jgi:sigma-B regulation protein RsbU (phosphoserine phosphatase)
MPRTIRWKLILSISIPLLVTYLGMLGWDYYRQRSAATEVMQREVLERAESTATNLDARLSGIMQWAESTATLIESRSTLTDVQQLRGVLQARLRQNPWAYSTAILMEPPGGRGMPHGFALRRGGGGPGGGRLIEIGAAARQTEMYARAKSERKPFWAGPFEDPNGDGRRVCAYVVPITIDDQFRGIAAASIAVDELRQLRGGGPARRERGAGDARGRFRGERPASQPTTAELRDSPPPSPSTAPPAQGTSASSTKDEEDDPIAALPTAAAKQLAEFGIFDADGRPVITPGDRSPIQSTIFETAESVGHPEVADAARQALAGRSQVVRVEGMHLVLPNVPPDAAHWIAFAPIPATGWALVTVIPESTVMSAILSRIGQRAIFLAVGSVILLMVVLLVSIRISRPIEHLAGAVDRLAAGDMDAQVTGIRSRDELGRLADGFNHMTRQLKAHVAALTEQTAAREKVESELRIARQIQTDMLPRTFPPFPDRPEFELHAINLPARRVAGDFYDFFFTPSGLLTLVIADVSGKGVPAALLMAVTRTIVRNLAMEGLPPREIAQRTNTMLIADTSGDMFVTMLLCQYDPATGRMTYVNCGHPPPLRFASGAVPARCCNVFSPILGVDDTGEMGPFAQGEETLSPGESLFCYTDGVPDARSRDGSTLGDAGLRDAVRSIAGQHPEALCRAIAAKLDEFQGGQRQDDITLVVLRRTTS